MLSLSASPVLIRVMGRLALRTVSTLAEEERPRRGFAVPLTLGHGDRADLNVPTNVGGDVLHCGDECW
jgi:hypothetical protein